MRNDLWPPTREEALRRLEDFLPHAGRHYANNRNFDRGPGRHDAVSTLSPWIRHRLLAEEEVVDAVLARHSFSAAEKFVQEVFWRTYWKGWLELRPSVWRDYRRRVRKLTDDLDRDADLRDRWSAATRGDVGIDCFDAWSRELLETGYLHNHARMWFASIWIFTLDLPWELGADFFLRHLLDGDPASNTLSWRWVAGLQTKGKTYLARPDNIARYTEGRFTGGGRLAREAPPLPGPPPPPLAPPRPGVWDPAVTTGLLLTDEDLNPSFFRGGSQSWRGLAVLATPQRRSPLPVSSLVGDFTAGGLRDACARLGSAADVHLSPDDIGGSAGLIVDWAKGAGIRQLVSAYVPVGPTAEVVEDLQRALSLSGLPLVLVPRNWDLAAWPHATHGFFRFRAKIPAIIRQAGIASVHAD